MENWLLATCKTPVKGDSCSTVGLMWVDTLLSKLDRTRRFDCFNFVTTYNRYQRNYRLENAVESFWKEKF